MAADPTSNPTSSPEPDDAPVLTSDPLHAVMLTDVRTGSSFSLGELAAQRPVLLETMAVWCTTCLSQQRAVREAHALADFESVSLDIDPNERADQLAEYAEREGFDWRFAVADASIATQLRDRFGQAVLNPPSTPIILLMPSGSVRALEFNRVRSAQELAAEIADG